MTFEEVDKQVSAAAPIKVPKTKADAQASLCGIYASVRPVLSFLVNFPFFPATWKTAIAGLLTTLDLLCPPTP